MTSPERDATDEPLPCLGGQFSALRQRVETANAPGNLDGLLARHILDGSQHVTGRVDPFSGTWLEDNADRLEEPGPLAVLGYGLSVRPDESPDAIQTICSGLRRLMQRNLFPGDRVSLLHDMRILLGVCLASKVVQSKAPEFQSWLRKTLEDQRLRPADRLHELAQRHVHATLSGHPIALDMPSILSGDEELAMACWMVDRCTAVLSDPLHGARELQKLAMRAALQVDPANLTVPQAALLLRVADNVLSTSVDRIVLSHSHVGVVLRRFEAAMRRWRWDSDELQRPIRWEVRSEREVQDILWIILRSVFDDVVDEDPLPKIGHSGYRADFGLPSLGILVEVKYVRKLADFKKIEDEVMIDSVAYLNDNDRYKEIIVFIYDESCSVEHHDTTQRALREVRGVADVIVVSRPGVLPVSTPASKR